MNIGELVWKIKGDTKDIDKSIKSTESKMGKFGNAVKAAFSVAALVLFAKKAFDVGRALINVASDAEETKNKFDVVFAGISRAGEAADNLAESYGLSHEASQNLLSSTSDLLQGFGVAKDESLDLSEQVQMLAADLSSFTNNEGGAEAASKALTSAMLGEREAVKSLGIAITDAELKRFAEETGQVYNEMSKAEKAVLTLNLAIRQSGNAIGDFERSQASFANQAKIAHANIDDLKVIMGEKLLPVAGRVVTAFNNIVGALIDIQMEKINLDKALAADETADYTKALEEQRRKIKELERNLENLTGTYGVNTDQLQRQIDAEKTELIILERIASNVKRAAGERENDAAATRKENEELEERLRLLREEEERLKAIEEQRLIAVGTLEENTARSLELFEEKAQAERDALAARTNAKAEALYTERKDEEDRHEQRMINLKSELAAASALAGNLGAIFGNLLQIQMAGDDEMTEKKKRNIITLYRIQQAANIAQILMDTRAAVMRQYKDLPVWLAVLSKIAVIGIGVTSIAAVANTPPPVALAEGGIVPARPGGTATIIGEGGQDEAVIPLDEGGMGSIRIIVNLDGQPILDTVQSGLNRREIIVEAGSVA